MGNSVRFLTHYDLWRYQREEVFMIKEINGRKGQSLAEYGLILALIAIVCISALQLLGGNISKSLQTIGNTLGGAMAPGGG